MTVVPVLATLVFPALLAWSAAVLGEAVGRRARRRAPDAPGAAAR